ncbi:tyrosine-type recombinase/integrase [Anaerocellum danielii]|uniref:Site-specific integrase n=1 Tax=Anaerocellum danielii TaxID=1387557 RepID=A0ABZ0TXQ2_9FIRM|nr:site-specific integrase [Caldicellulosiruptor danielii]WPX08229.1 site-specific integrase [Caldicellulosiruptor danielii]
MARRGKGEGSIFKRKDGRWCGFITLGYDEKGNQKKKFFYGKTRQEVAEKINQALNELKQGVLIAEGNITLEEWLRTWLWEYKRPQISESTFDDYESIIRNHINPVLGKYKLKDLRPEHLQHLYNEKFKAGLSPRRIKHIHTILHASLEQAIKSGLIVRNVSKATTLPKDTKEKEIRVLTLEEQKKLLEALEGERLKAAFILALTTGMRLGEILGLKWDRVDLENKQITVVRSLRRIKSRDNSEIKTKTVLTLKEVKSEKANRIIPIPDIAYEELLKYREQQEEEKNKAGSAYRDSGFVFTTEVGTPIEPRNFIRTFERIVKKAGLDVNFHALRHTFATRLLEKNVHPKVVQELLGHSDITTTLNTYSHVLDTVKKEAIKEIDCVFTELKKDNPT